MVRRRTEFGCGRIASVVTIRARQGIQGPRMRSYIRGSPKKVVRSLGGAGPDR